MELRKPTIPRTHPWEGPADELEEVLKRTIGRTAVSGTGDANRHRGRQIHARAKRACLRRAMATFRHNGTIHLFEDKFINGMASRGYDRKFARKLL